MDGDTKITLLVVALVGARAVAQLVLDELNQRSVRAHAGRLPEAFRGVMDDATFARANAYALANGRFSQVETLFDAAILLTVLFSGLLPWAFEAFAAHGGNSAWAMAACLFVVFAGVSLVGLPLQWWDQFRLEARFGFNTSTQATWWLDRVKGLLLGAVLGVPLLALVLKCFVWAGAAWWLWAWAALLAFQCLMFVLAPVVILPLFNKFTPLADGPLRDRLLALAARTQFRAASIQVMDGSRRSKHSNAFFAGLGRFRRIVLFDTLIAQLAEAELEAVLAHEIGHWRRRHIVKHLALAALGSLAAFAVIGWLAGQAWFPAAFGLPAGHPAAVLLLFGLLAGTVTFWFGPLGHWLTRRHEYEADAFAREAMGGPEALIGALRKLNEKNLANLTPHPLYSGFYYSHPTLLERERALTTAR